MIEAYVRIDQLGSRGGDRHSQQVRDLEAVVARLRKHGEIPLLRAHALVASAGLGVTPGEARRDAEILIGRIHTEDRAGFERSLDRSAESLRPWS